MNTPRFVKPDGSLTLQTKKIGMRMGNRGTLGPILLKQKQPHASSVPWIACILHNDDGVPLPKKEPQVKYTKLFFLDEVTSFAAGHRPCGQCQTERYNLFVKYWEKVTQKPLKDLQNECCNEDGSKKTFPSALGKLQSGVMFRLSENDQPYLLLNGKCFPWTINGYGNPVAFSASTEVQVLTPEPIVKMLSAGFPLLNYEKDKQGSVYPSSSIIGGIMASKRHEIIFDRAYWKIPSAKSAFDGYLEGAPTAEEKKQIIDKAIREQKSWEPSKEAWDQFNKAKDAIGNEVEVQLWDPIMSLCDDEGPYPILAQCNGSTLISNEECKQQAYLILENVRNQKTPHGYDGISLLRDAGGEGVFLLPLASIYSISWDETK